MAGGWRRTRQDTAVWADARAPASASVSCACSGGSAPPSSSHCGQMQSSKHRLVSCSGPAGRLPAATANACKRQPAVRRCAAADPLVVLQGTPGCWKLEANTVVQTATAPKLPPPLDRHIRLHHGHLGYCHNAAPKVTATANATSDTPDL